MDNDVVGMGRQKRRSAVIAGAREAGAIAATLGRGARATRLSRQLTQAALGEKVGLSQSEISHLERGGGARTPLETWVAIGMALERPLAVGFSRDVADPAPRDAGHLAAQELILRLAAATGRTARFELSTRPSNPSRSVDVGEIDRVNRVLILIEIWNRLDDIGAATRATDRKVAEAGGLTLEPGGPRRVASCWVLVDTAANREIVRRYPAILRSRFGGSSAAWVRALVDGSAPPTEPGIVWAAVHTGRLTEVRLRR
jgi:transcriptional regulator with XRE-family HTH domain